MPQTREHLEILSLLGITKGVIAVTKVDLVDQEWLALVVSDARSAIEGTSMREAGIVAVSALNGTGVTELKAHIRRLFATVVPRDASDDLFRMPVDRSFTIKGTGTVVTGTVWSGQMEKDSTVLIQPGGLRVRVRGLQFHGSSVPSVKAGDRAAIALAGCEVLDVGRGTTLIGTPDWPVTRELYCSIELDSAFADLSPRTRLRFHLGTSESGGRLSRMRRANGSKGLAFARVVLDEPVLARGGDRFILRLPSPARTIGGGVVIDPLPARRLQVSSPDGEMRQRLASMLESAGLDGLAITAIPVRTGVTISDLPKLLAAMDVIRAGDRIVLAKSIRELEDLLAQYVHREMGNHPLEAGVSLEAAKASVRAPRAVIDEAFDRLKKSGRIEVAGAVARPSGWTENLGEAERSLSAAILHDICVQAAEPPSVGELAGKFGDLTEPLLRRLERTGELARVAEDRYYAVTVVSGMVGRLRAELQRGRIYSPAELREVLGVSRKYLIPFLEFCDRTGVTERREKGREIRPA